MRRAVAVSVWTLSLAFTSTRAVAQVTPSEHGTVSQRVNATTITVSYDRPGARGRTLFGDGGIVKADEMWTPGANWATTIDVDHDVTIEGRTLPKGVYSVWLVPHAASPWTMVFSRTARVFHTRPPAESDAQLRVPVRPEQGAYMETLAWYFPIVTPAGATLRMHWGRTIVPLQIGVGLPEILSLPEDRRAPYPGSYRVHVVPKNGAAPYDVRFRVRDADGVLKLTSEPANVLGGEQTMIPVTEGRFHVAVPAASAFVAQLYATPGLLLVFETSGGHARSVRLVGYDGIEAGQGEVMH